MKKWFKIRKFSDAKACADAKGFTGTLQWRAKVKLHGANAGLLVENGGIVPIQRSGPIPEGEENYGFRDWSSKLTLRPDSGSLSGTTLWGEWVGKGVQKNDAIHKTSKRHHLFAVTTPERHLYTEPEDVIRMALALFGERDDIRAIPWQGDPLGADMSDEDGIREMLLKAAAMTDEVAAQDPYVHRYFGETGSGEGLVFYPMGEHETVTGLFWKMVAEGRKKERTSRTRTTPRKPDGTDEFIELFVTENRMRQILDEKFDGIRDVKRTGQFIGAVLKDVHEETVNERKNSKMDWKVVSRYATGKIREFFLR